MDAPHVILIRHSDATDDATEDDRIAEWARSRALELRTARPCAGDAVPRPNAQTCLTVIYGGAFPVDALDAHPFLKDEIALAKGRVDAGAPFVGVCLGAQVLAAAVGARAGAPRDASREFGVFEVRPTSDGGAFLPEPIMPLLAHYHSFDAPDGAVRLAESDRTPCQAMRIGSAAYGLQFHPEATATQLKRWRRERWVRDAFPMGADGVQQAEVQDLLEKEHGDGVSAWLRGFLDDLVFGRRAGGV